MNRKEKIWQFMSQKSYVPLKYEELKLVLDVPTADEAQFNEILEELIDEGKVVKTKKSRFMPVKNLGFVSGEFSRNEKGFGFVTPEGEDADIFISAENSMGAMHKDIVMVRVFQNARDGKRREGEITKIIQHIADTVVGRFESSRNFAFVVPQDKRMGADIFISKKDTLKARNGQIVVAKITDYGKPGRNPEGKVIEILGFPESNDTKMLAVLRQYGLQSSFPPKVLAQAEAIPDVIDDLRGRLDLRKECIITIDGEDARDLDDAISVKHLSNGNYQLGVHIADVSHYVKKDSAIDKEAYKRGTSVYFPEKVIPMLPTKLSNGLCSLHPHVDRLTMSLICEVDASGKVVDYSIHKSIINSTERMTYHTVTAILEGDKELIEQYRHIYPMLKDAEQLANILRSKRDRRGSIDFDFPEAKIILDESGKPIDIQKYEITISNKIIEEFMLCANETIAEHVFWLSKPFIYRVHELPDEEKVANFAKVAYNLGYPLKSQNELRPKMFADILKKCKGQKEEMILQTLMLRSLMKAKYSEENKGHFGLAAKYYCHFTSPIRRYPDLIVHRVLKMLLGSGIKNEKKLADSIRTAAEHLSVCEQIAEDAERDFEDIKKAEYMQQYIGEEFDAVISSVTAFGFFAELPNTVEGLVHITTLDDDYYIFDSENLTLIGERTKNTYRLGDEVRIRVTAVQDSKIDFETV